ncbi:DUF1905 domain-containing protein [Flavobacterium sp.]|uniref:DUF1905 domain-containing protein n=1 Tax=Flavobacterium sp. TaxID=239 RepID=UPI003D0997A0
MEFLIKYTFSATIWQYEGPNGWYFVSLPQDISKEIRDNLKWQEEGWGRLKASAQIGTYEWKTAVWFDTKQNTYLLPIKADVRTKCKLEKGQVTEVSVFV